MTFWFLDDGFFEGVDRLATQIVLGSPPFTIPQEFDDTGTDFTDSILERVVWLQIARSEARQLFRDHDARIVEVSR